jgi:hypothetical protein
VDQAAGTIVRRAAAELRRATVAAEANRVQTVPAGCEPGSPGDRRDRILELGLKVWGQGEVAERTTCHTGEVVMVADESLIQFVAGELGVPGDGVHNSAVCEHAEVAVDAATVAPAARHDLLRRQRTTRGPQKLDERLTGLRIPASPGCQACRGDGMD